jgi:hypothetical protein
MSLQRRLFLYFIGLVIGGGMAYFIYGDRVTNGAWLPESKVKQRLIATLVKAVPAAEQDLQAWPADLEQVRMAIPRSTVSFKESIRRNDSIYYAIDATLNGREARMVIVGLRDFDRDSTATLWSVDAR